MKSQGHMSLIGIFAVVLLVSACGEQSAAPEPPAGTELAFEDELRLALETAESGDIILIPEGTHSFSRGLILNTDGVTIRGSGMDKSILNFAGQIAGAEGLLVNASDFTIEDLAIEDTVGDALKVNEGRNIVIRRVRTEWTRGPHTENGAYGIYPVQTENTLVEGVVAIGASDAGIYVGQSRNVIVQDSLAEFNVAGIEIENTVGADVFNNVATNNTGGILVFNMPDLPQEGHSTRVFNNAINGNNTGNFAPPGGAVSGVPAGSGIVINSNDRVEIFGNEIRDNKTANVLISSFFSASYSARETAEHFDPYPETIYVYDNDFSGGGDAPDREELEQLRAAMFAETGRLPDVVWDGISNPEKTDPDFAICVNNGDALLVNVDAGNNYQNVSVDMSNHSCDHEKLSAISLSAGG